MNPQIQAGMSTNMGKNPCGIVNSVRRNEKWSESIY